MAETRTCCATTYAERHAPGCPQVAGLPSRPIELPLRRVPLTQLGGVLRAMAGLGWGWQAVLLPGEQECTLQVWVPPAMPGTWAEQVQAGRTTPDEPPPVCRRCGDFVHPDEAAQLPPGLCLDCSLAVQSGDFIGGGR